MEKRNLFAITAVGLAAAIAVPTIAFGNARNNDVALNAVRASQTAFTARLTGPAELTATTPTGDSDGLGAAAITFDLNASIPNVCWDFTYSNIATPITAAHIHTGVAGVAGAAVITFDATTFGATSATGCANLTAPEVLAAPAIVANPAGFYVNLHNATYVAPSGAIRGQLAGSPPAGDLHLLPQPLRAYDSRTVDGPIALNATRTISLATGLDSANATVLALPPGATGAIVTLTLTDTSIANGPGGFLKLYSAVLTTPPTTSSINWTGAGQNLAVTTQVAVDATGQVKVTDGANPTDFVIDVIGYLF